MTLKGKFNMVNGFFDPRGGIGVGVGAPYTTLEKEDLLDQISVREQVRMRELRQNVAKLQRPPCLTGDMRGVQEEKTGQQVKDDV
eukprot:2248083-Rhodomonas_salina.2